jgi:hypothetical protein
MATVAAVAIIWSMSSTACPLGSLDNQRGSRAIVAYPPENGPLSLQMAARMLYLLNRS